MKLARLWRSNYIPQETRKPLHSTVKLALWRSNYLFSFMPWFSVEFLSVKGSLGSNVRNTTPAKVAMAYSTRTRINTYNTRLWLYWWIGVLNEKKIVQEGTLTVYSYLETNIYSHFGMILNKNTQKTQTVFQVIKKYIYTYIKYQKSVPMWCPLGGPGSLPTPWQIYIACNIDISPVFWWAGKKGAQH